MKPYWYFMETRRINTKSVCKGLIWEMILFVAMELKLPFSYPQVWRLYWAWTVESVSSDHLYYRIPWGGTDQVHMGSLLSLLARKMLTNKGMKKDSHQAFTRCFISWDETSPPIWLIFSGKLSLPVLLLYVVSDRPLFCDIKLRNWGCPAAALPWRSDQGCLSIKLQK